MVKNTPWDRVAGRYHANVGETGGFHHRTSLNPLVLGYLGDVRGMRILDLGCGQGYFTRLLAKGGAHVVGVDISGELLRIAQKKETEERLGIRYLHRDAASLRGIKDGEFDIIVSNMAFQDIEDLPAAVKECSRALRPGGRLILSILHPMIDSLKAGEFSQDARGPYLKMRSYGAVQRVPHRVYWLYGVPLFHRPLDYYFGSLMQSGFCISGFREVFPQSAPGAVSTSLLQRIVRRALKAVGGHHAPQGGPPPGFWKDFPLFVVAEATKGEWRHMGKGAQPRQK